MSQGGRDSVFSPGIFFLSFYGETDVTFYSQYVNPSIEKLLEGKGMV